MIDIIKIGRDPHLSGVGVEIWISVEDYHRIDEKLDHNINIYYLDDHYLSKTKGELFDKFPSDEGAKILDKSQFNFMTKEQLEREEKINNIIDNSIQDTNPWERLAFMVKFM